MATSAQRRRRYFVDPQVQGALLTQLLRYWLCGLATFVLIVFVYRVAPAWLSSDGSAGSSFWYSLGPLVVASLVVLPVVVLSLVRFSNRIVGPMVRFRKSLQQLARGETVAPLRLREGDFWMDVASDINQIAAKLAELSRESASAAQDGIEQESDDGISRDQAAAEETTSSQAVVPKGSDIVPKGSDIVPKGSDIVPKGSDIVAKGSDIAPKGSDMKQTQPGRLKWGKRNWRQIVKRRRGAASVEFAIVAPILFLIVLAIVQFGGLMLIRNVLTSAAREGTRVAALSSTTSSGPVIAAIQNRLRQGGVDPNLIAVDVNPSTFESLTSGAEVRVTLTGYASQLTILWPNIMPVDPTLIAEMTYNRE